MGKKLERGAYCIGQLSFFLYGGPFHIEYLVLYGVRSLAWNICLGVEGMV